MDTLCLQSSCHFFLWDLYAFANLHQFTWKHDMIWIRPTSKNQPPCLSITSCEVGMKHRFEESLKGNWINKLNLFNIPRLEHENKRPSSEETVLPNPRCLILIYVSSMVVLGWCSCVCKPLGRLPDPPHTKDTFQVCRQILEEEDQGGYTPINVAIYIVYIIYDICIYTVICWVLTQLHNLTYKNT